MADRENFDIKDKTVYGLVRLLQVKEKELHKLRNKYEELYENTCKEKRRTMESRDGTTQTNDPSRKDVSIQADSSRETCSDDNAMDLFTQVDERNCRIVDSKQTKEDFDFPDTILNNITLSIAIDETIQENDSNLNDVSIQTDSNRETYSDDMDFSTQFAESSCHIVDSKQTKEYFDFPETDENNMTLSIANETNTRKEVMKTASTDGNENLDSFKGYTDLCSYQKDIDLEHIYVTIEDTTVQCPRLSETNEETMKQLPKCPGHSKPLAGNFMRMQSSRNLSHTCKHSSKKIPGDETSYKCFMRYQMSRSVIKRKRRSLKTRCNSETTLDNTMHESLAKPTHIEHPTVISQLRNNFPNSYSANMKVLKLDLDGSKFETISDDVDNCCSINSTINDTETNSHKLNKVYLSDCQECVSACHDEEVCHGNDSVEQDVYHGKQAIEQEVCHWYNSTEHDNDGSTCNNLDSYNTYQEKYKCENDIFPSIQFTNIDAVSENNDSDLRTCSQLVVESDEPISNQEKYASYRECDTANVDTVDDRGSVEQRRLDKFKLYLYNGLDENINESFV